jgi:hypothetical protein
MMIGFGNPIIVCYAYFGIFLVQFIWIFLMRVLFVNHWPILLYYEFNLTSSNTDTSPIAQQTIYLILFSIAFAHLLNDLL